MQRDMQSSSSRLMYSAAERGDVKEVSRLLKENVTYSVRLLPGSDFPDPNGRESDAFYIAAKNGHHKVVELFLKDNEAYEKRFHTSKIEE